MIGSRFLVGGALLAAAAGCGDAGVGYPSDLTYPDRAGVLVISPPPATPDRPTPQGEGLPEYMASLADRGADTLDPAALTDVESAAVREALASRFGTPAAPTGEAFGLSAESLKAGSDVYRKSCLNCHGITGNGRGPAGPFLNPLPRDFRRGEFKFVSTGGPKPGRDDLLRTLRRGLPGSAMPPFGKIGDDRLDSLADYVIYLSARGEVEFHLIRAILEFGATPEATDAEADAAVDRVAASWRAAAAADVGPRTIPDIANEGPDDPAYAASVRRGRRLFTDPQGPGCFKCHSDYGRRAQPRYDAWGLPVRPRDLTRRPRRGGGRPIDIYHRLRCGIGPSGMPSFGHLSERDVWDLVRFVSALPYPARMPLSED